MDEELRQELLEDALPLEESASDSGNILDATQNAIMDAAENVSHALENSGASEAVAHAPEPFYLEIEFWVGVAFVLAVLVLIKPLFKFVKAALQRRVAKVVNDIYEAVKLRDDAQKLLADYERKFSGVDSEVSQILQQSEHNLENLRKVELARMQSDAKVKEKEALRRMAASTAKVQAEINLSASKASIDLAKKSIMNYIETTDKSRLIDEAIAELDNL